jgi:uncharacterized protein YecT (DUF1311 family)
VQAATVLALLLICAATEAEAGCARNEHGVFEDGACAAQAFANADRQLNEVYQRLLPQLDVEAQTKLRVSQRAWLAYRDATSAFV